VSTNNEHVKQLVEHLAAESAQFITGTTAQASGASSDLLPSIDGADTSGEPAPGPVTRDLHAHQQAVIVDGARLSAACGRQYVVSNLRHVPLATERDGQRQVHLEPFALTLRRAIPKVRGKAARKADKRARAALRRSQAHAQRVAAVEQRLEREAPPVDW
jgi:hypothetical protein